MHTNQPRRQPQRRRTRLGLPAVVQAPRQSSPPAVFRAQLEWGVGISEDRRAMVAVRIPSGDRVLSGNLHGPVGVRPGLLFLHGLNSSQAGYLARAEEAAAKLGAMSVTFDLSGHGASSGDV